MKKFRMILKSNLLFKKIIWTLVFIFISILGTKIPLPLISHDAPGDLPFDSILDLTNNDETRRSIMALGISPLISGNIIWQVLTITKIVNLKKIPKKRADFQKHLLILLISLIQGSIVVLSLMNVSTFSAMKDWETFYILLLFVVAGAFIMVFLGNMNSELGLGSYMIFLLIGIMNSSISRVFTLLSSEVYIDNSIYIILFSIFLLLSSVILDTAQYRIKINSILTNNEMYDKSYIAVKLNPSGGMAFMYAMTFTVLPQLLFRVLGYVFPGQEWIVFFINNMDLKSEFGVSIYLIMLFLLSLGFSFVNVNPEDITKKLKFSGDYISFKKPGKPTYNYLKTIVLNMGLIGAIYTMVIAGFPLLYGLYNKELFDLMTLPGSLMISVGMVLFIYDELLVLRITSKYKELFD